MDIANALILFGFIWGVVIVFNLVLVLVPYTNTHTGQRERAISAKAPADSWLWHIFFIAMFVLCGPLTWIGIGIDILLYPTYPPEA